VRALLDTNILAVRIEQKAIKATKWVAVVDRPTAQAEHAGMADPRWGGVMF
jgi:hypothetical protein